MQFFRMIRQILLKDGTYLSECYLRGSTVDFGGRVVRVYLVGQPEALNNPDDVQGASKFTDFTILQHVVSCGLVRQCGHRETQLSSHANRHRKLHGHRRSKILKVIQVAHVNFATINFWDADFRVTHSRLERDAFRVRFTNQKPCCHSRDVVHCDSRQFYGNLKHQIWLSGRKTVKRLQKPGR